MYTTTNDWLEGDLRNITTGSSGTRLSAKTIDFFFLAPSYNVIVRSNFFWFQFWIMCVQVFGVKKFYKDKINFEVMMLDEKSKYHFVKALSTMWMNVWCPKYAQTLESHTRMSWKNKNNFWCTSDLVLAMVKKSMYCLIPHLVLQLYKSFSSKQTSETALVTDFVPFFSAEVARSRIKQFFGTSAE
mgnify:CR=1 FL=1